MPFDIHQANPPGVTEALRNAEFLIFGAGGLGSNAAAMLVRAGAVNLTIVDFDVIAPSNLNRQFYFADQVGMKKVLALKENLLRINPEIRVETIDERVDSANLAKFSAIPANVVLECFDDARSKAELVAHFIKNKPETPIVAVSGLAGTASIESFETRPGPGKLLVIRDSNAGAPETYGTLSTRVTAAAAIQSHEAIGILLSPHQQRTKPNAT